MPVVPETWSFPKVRIKARKGSDEAKKDAYNEYQRCRRRRRRRRKIS
jgi:hypothetical protein